MRDYKKVIATTYAGLEDVLAGELGELKYRNIEVLRRAVSFSASLEEIYRANYCLTTALKILVPVRDFKISSSDDLYNRCLEIHWEDFFDVTKTFAVQHTVFSDVFKNTMFASLRLKDAIVDRFRQIENKRPSVDTKNPDIVINLHISGNDCNISLDSSGESLHKRGYRIENHIAPISEVLAAGMLKLSGWTGDSVLMDPMCGSGTIAIEAAMMASGIRPGEVGRKYSFQSWDNYSPEIFKKIVDDVHHSPLKFPIYGSDISKENIKKSIVNSQEAGVDDIVLFDNADFFKSENKKNIPFLIFNPPYGERMEDGDDLFYEQIGDTMKNNYHDCQAWIISTKECLKSLGLKPSKKIPLFNGPLECSYRKYEMYSGSRKWKKQMDSDDKQNVQSDDKQD